jgi:hypothetical protein
MSTKAARRNRTATKAQPDTTTSARYLIPGHWAGERAFIGTAVDTVGDWVVYDSNAGTRPPDYWNGVEWLPLTPQSARAGAHCWSKEEAERLARHYAAGAGEISAKAVTPERAEFLHWLQTGNPGGAPAAQAMLGRLRAARQPIASVLPRRPAEDVPADDVPARTLPRAVDGADDGPVTERLPAARVIGPEETAPYPLAVVPDGIRSEDIPPMPSLDPEELRLEPVPATSWTGKPRAQPTT